MWPKSLHLYQSTILCPVQKGMYQRKVKKSCEDRNARGHTGPKLMGLREELNGFFWFREDKAEIRPASFKQLSKIIARIK